MKDSPLLENDEETNEKMGRGKTKKKVKLINNINN